ncbi:hypothetical protein LOD99_10479 [Oopsacas minuta]|uniref:Cilia- and flagella-associated protein 161 n=1 Tax=Oopsacas minuta TaxID=111878 RepID=A0AAV7KFM6_9METZ|nr:hypothetical protein LOD99_10479 [Oopsacas minuta]
MSYNHLEPGKTTYIPSVRIGNWREDLALEEEMFREFLSKKEAGELLIQKSSALLQQVTTPVDISSDKETISFGDKIIIFHAQTQHTLSAHIPVGVLHLSDAIKSPCSVTGSTSLLPTVRNTFTIHSVSPEVSDGDPVRFNQPFYLKTQEGPGGDLYLHSDTASFSKDAKKSRQQEVLLVSPASYFCAWKILCVRERDRLETEGETVPANSIILLNHCRTNQNLSCLSQFSYKTNFGLEHEITAHTHYTQYKTIGTQNHWVLMNKSPSKVMEESKKSPEQ